MLVVYRPHRGGLTESMDAAKEFSSLDEMKEYIVSNWDNAFTKEDIFVSDKREDDPRINWDGQYYVGIKRLRGEDYIQKYGCPQCIGHCTYGYK